MDAIEFLTSQHRAVEQMWSQLQTSHADGSHAQDELVEGIVTMLSQHDAIETQLLYPELRDVGGKDGQQLSKQSLAEHQQVREMLSEVDGRDIHDDAVFTTLSQCITAVMQHVLEEEQQIFPLLRRQSGPERLTELGQEMSELQSKAPTHPHKHMPNSKVGAAVAGAVAGVADRARDAKNRPAD